MTKTWVMTIPRTVPKKALRLMIEKNDCKKWTIGFEVGNDGYRHYQVRLVSSNDNFFQWVKAHIPTAHVEEGNKNWNDYERKSGNFISSEDTDQIRQVRFGTLNQFQKKVLQEVRSQNVRQIDVYLDPSGHHGKSWLVNYLWERGECHYIPPYLGTGKAIIQDVASKMEQERRSIICIDIVRNQKWTDDLYIALEVIKDGLVDDPRYSGKTINIRGTKVIVFTNAKLDTKKLTFDRWRLHGVGGSKHPPTTPHENDEDSVVGKTLS